MVYECKICKFETTILTHFNTHKATKKHIKRCEECEAEPVKDVQETSKIAELEKRIMELEMQLKMKDEMIEFLKTHAQPAQTVQVVQPVKTHKKEPEQKTEKPAPKPEDPVANDKEMDMLTTKIKARSTPEALAFLESYTSKSVLVSSWIANEMTKLLCEGENEFKINIPVVKQIPVNLCPNVVEVYNKYNDIRLKAMFPDGGVQWLEYRGITYILRNDNTVFDVDTEEEVGHYDGEDIQFI